MLDHAPGNGGRDSVLIAAVRGVAVAPHTNSSLPAGKSSGSYNGRNEFPQMDYCALLGGMEASPKGLRETGLALR